MKLDEFVQVNPITVQRSQRREATRLLTSAMPGKIIPVGYFPLLREDQIRTGTFGLSVRMAETVRPILNAVNVRVHAHLVPWSAFERFDGMDAFNRSYQGENEPGTGNPVEFFPTVSFDRTAEFWNTLGMHWPQGTSVNRMPLEAYNVITNFRRRARTKHLMERALTDATLARAFWVHPLLYDIVPDYEEALIDGAVPLELIGDGRLDVHSASWKEYTVAPKVKWPTASSVPAYTPDGSSGDYVFSDKPDGQGVWVELSEAGFDLSLSNIERAKETVAFARLRQQYKGVEDDHLIDLAMDAVRFPPEAARQPILLGRASGAMTLTERYATDGSSLGDSVTTGAINLSMRLRAPRINTGGVVMFTAEITPEPLFERLKDPFLGIDDPDTLPRFLRDYLDPKKIDVVDNDFVDVLHSDPTGVFGYRGLNREWDRDYVRAGGRFYRPNNDAFVEDRQRFWVVESDDPALDEDFYLVSEKLPLTPFADQNSDPFEIVSAWNCTIEGNTVFGRALEEDGGEYQATVEQSKQE